MMSSYRMETTCIAHHVNQKKKITAILRISPKICISYDNDGDATSNISDNSDGWFLLGHHYYKDKYQLVFYIISGNRFYTESNQSHSIIKVDWVRWGKKCMNWPRTLCNGPTNPCNQMVKLEFKESCRDPIA